MHVDAFSLPVQTRAPSGTTNAYVVGSERCLLVDPAARSSTLDTVVATSDVAAIAVTHTHPDHVGAVAGYAAETDAELLARRPDRFREATGVEPDRQISEGSTIQTGVGPVSVLDVPGHAADHVAFELPDGGRAGSGASEEYEDRGGTVLAGDLAVVEGSVAVGAPEGDLRAYLTSLRRLWARNPRRLYPGHGPAIGGAVVTDDGPVRTDSGHVESRSSGGPEPRTVLERLIRHRLDREARVLAAVQTGTSTLDAVVDAAYEKDISAVRDLAQATVRAHVEKLAVEGSILFDPESGAVAVP
jgi:glyoxylase-like metal-dependent hydrolase (beta-lactamase superfamily II)